MKNMGRVIKKAARIITAGAVIVCFCGCTKYEIKNRNSQGKNIVCFGDSIAAGATVLPDESFPALLTGMVRLAVINAGVPGDTTKSALLRLEKDVLEKDPCMVIVELGGNDYLRRMPLSGAARNIREITERIVAFGSMAVLLDMSSGLIMENYAKEYRKIARETGAIFIAGVMEGVFTDPSLRNDSIHPNARGHVMIAERIFEGIKEYLPYNGQ